MVLLLRSPLVYASAIVMKTYQIQLLEGQSESIQMIDDEFIVDGFYWSMAC